MCDKVWIFDSSKFDGTTSALTLVKELRGPSEGGTRVYYLGWDGRRFYWVRQFATDRPHPTKYDNHLYSALLSDPDGVIDHGLMVDAHGRMPEFHGDIHPDGKGRVYMVGRWGVPDQEAETASMKYADRNVAVFFWVADVSKDLPER